MMIFQTNGDLRKVSLGSVMPHMQTTEIYLRADPTEKIEAIEGVTPPALRVVGQRFYGESGPSFLHIGLKFEYTEGDPHYFPEVFVLHKQLLDYHRRLRVEIPGAQNDLALEDPTRYEKNIQCYRAKRVLFSFYCAHG